VDLIRMLVLMQDEIRVAMQGVFQELGLAA